MMIDRSSVVELQAADGDACARQALFAPFAPRSGGSSSLFQRHDNLGIWKMLYQHQNATSNKLTKRAHEMTGSYRQKGSKQIKSY